MTVTSSAGRTAARLPRWNGATGTYPQWYEDPLSCLQTTLGSILLEHGLRPVDVLGQACEFVYAPGDVMCEEFYRPERGDRGVAGDLCPYHDVESVWTSGSTADDLIALLEEHSRVIVAVDNYYLPFRPAYGDVHAAHLVVVVAWRRATGGETEFYVSDAQPPAFQGWLSARHLIASWTSGNPSDTQDVFFSSREIGGRALTTTVRRRPDEPAAAQARRAFSGDLDNWDGGTAGPADRLWTGRAGLRRFADLLCEQAADPAALRPAYTFGWAMQAQAFLHGRFARDHARASGDTRAAAVAVSADRVVAAWSNVRLLSAHAPTVADVSALIRRRGEELLHAYEQLAADWRLVLAPEGVNAR